MRHKNRGMMLESLINRTIKFYDEHELALFHKKELNISFAKIREEGGSLKIDNGRVKTKSTTDYYGLYNGRFYAFEAKSTNLKSLPIANIKEHQMDYLNKVINYGGIAFFIVAFQMFDEYYVIYPGTINSLDRKSLSIDIARKEGKRLTLTYPGILDFIGVVE